MKVIIQTPGFKAQKKLNLVFVSYLMNDIPSENG